MGYHWCLQIMAAAGMRFHGIASHSFSPESTTPGATLTTVKKDSESPDCAFSLSNDACAPKA